MATYSVPGLSIVSLDDDAGATKRTGIGTMKAVEEAMRVAAAPRNTCVATILPSIAEAN